MKVSSMRVTALSLLVLAAFAPARGNLVVRQPAVQATAMASLEGEACSEDEHKRFQTIVCKIEETCKCADTRCALDWCADYVHEWKNTFGACILKGCGASKEIAESDASEAEAESGASVAEAPAR